MSRNLNISAEELIKELKEFPSSFQAYNKRERENDPDTARPQKKRKKKHSEVITHSEKQKIMRRRKKEYIAELEKKIQTCYMYLQHIQNLEFPKFDFNENYDFFIK